MVIGWSSFDFGCVIPREMRQGEVCGVYERMQRKVL
jgi:hypothetical protein